MPDASHRGSVPIVTGGRTRILLAVEPGVLAGALRRLLEDADTGEVVTLDPHSSVEPDHYDVAIVVSDLPAHLGADVVIQLPDGRGNAGTGLVIDLRGRVPVPIDCATDMLDLLDERHPARRSDRDRHSTG
jgi:hypothetical protein